MNAFLRMGRTCASMMIAGGLLGGALLANMDSQISVALPHTVTVGATTLPAGDYKLTSFAMGGQEYFIVRGEHGELATLHAVQTNDDASRTELVFSRDGETWRFDRLAIADGGVYSFVDGK